MNTQFNLFTPKERGIKRATDHANRVHDGWSEQAYSFLVDFIRVTPGEFMTEDVRTASKWIVPAPPSLRAWGSCVRRAAMDGLIKRVGYGQVKNERAHSCFASKWTRI
jgi:hypothetical protein